MKIAIAGVDFSPEQEERLKSLGDVVSVSADSSEAWLKAVENADVICSDGSYLLENIYNLKDVFVTYSFIELGSFDSEKLATNGVSIANTQGSNRDSIVEWVMFMTIGLFRKLPIYLNSDASFEFTRNESLVGKKVLIIGKGNIGTKVGELCSAFGMNVDYFLRGENLSEKALRKDLIINALNANSSSKNLLDEAFFSALSRGTYFVSFVRPYTYDLAGLIKALDNGNVAGAAIDCDPEEPYDTKNEFYQTVQKHEKILATPHVAFATWQAKTNGSETVVKNVEAFVSGKPQNILTKK